MIAAEAEPLPDGTPGYARVVVTGAPKPPGPLAFNIRREGYTQGFLGRNGWQATEEMLTPVEVVPEPASGGFAVILGPEVSRHMTAAPYVFRLPALNAELPIFWPEIEDEVPGIEYVRTTPRETPPVQGPSSTTTTTMQTETPPVRVDPPVTGGDTPPREEEKPRRPWIWVVLLLVLAAVGAGLYVFREPIFGGGEQAAPAPVPAPAPAPVPPQRTETPAPAWPAGTDGFTPREVVAQAADGAAILAVAKRRQSQGRHDDAYTLLEEAAQRDQAEAWFLLARLYDPIGFVAGRPFQTPNAYEAARHYREAAQRGFQAAAEPRAALRAQLQQRADGGDAEAANILREFWP